MEQAKKEDVRGKWIYWIPFVGLYYGVKINTPFENNTVSLIAFIMQLSYIFFTIVSILYLIS